MPHARAKPMNESSTCSDALGSICALVNSHCNSRARRRSNPSLIGAWIRRLTKLARNDSCISSSRSKRRPRKSARRRHNSRRVAALSKVINSTSGSISLISLASTLPMIQVNRVSGQAAWKARSAANAWQVSPIAERRSRHTCCSGGLKLKVVIRMIKGGQRIATATGVMLADPNGLGNPLKSAAESLFDPGYWSARGELSSVSGGRGSAWFIGPAPQPWVLRHYRRGGFIARISLDRYWWLGEDRVRAFAEWRLLEYLVQRGLRVPRPVAAGYRREGATYRCDLI